MSMFPFVRLEADANLENGETGVRLEFGNARSAARIEIGIVADRCAVDKVLLRLGVEELIEIITAGEAQSFEKRPGPNAAARLKY